MDTISKIKREIHRFSIHEFAFLKPDEVIFSDEVRDLCKKNTCRMYGTSWACPPAVGRIEECKAQCLRYQHAFLFTTLSKTKNKFDLEGWKRAHLAHEKITDEVAEVFRFYDTDALVLSAEGCRLCKKCTYPESPCTFPDRMHPATEGFGILVIQQAKACGIKYYNGPNTVTYFSMDFLNG
ncbi:MAG: DUF2284 domain-containing protein [Desulfobacteraceae bacterium]